MCFARALTSALQELCTGFPDLPWAYKQGDFCAHSLFPSLLVVSREYGIREYNLYAILYDMFPYSLLSPSKELAVLSCTSAEETLLHRLVCSWATSVSSPILGSRGITMYFPNSGNMNMSINIPPLVSLSQTTFSICERSAGIPLPPPQMLRRNLRAPETTPITKAVVNADLVRIPISVYYTIFGLGPDPTPSLNSKHAPSPKSQIRRF